MIDDELLSYDCTVCENFTFCKTNGVILSARVDETPVYILNFNQTCPKAAKTEETPDMVNNPPHYTQGGIECIDAIKSAVTGKSPYEAWLVGQVIKYVWRYNFKNGIEDLEKAEFYLKRLLKEVEGKDA